MTRSSARGRNQEAIFLRPKRGKARDQLVAIKISSPGTPTRRAPWHFRRTRAARRQGREGRSPEYRSSPGRSGPRAVRRQPTQARRDGREDVELRELFQRFLDETGGT